MWFTSLPNSFVPWIWIGTCLYLLFWSINVCLCVIVCDRTKIINVKCVCKLFVYSIGYGIASNDWSEEIFDSGCKITTMSIPFDNERFQSNRPNKITLHTKQLFSNRSASIWNDTYYTMSELAMKKRHTHKTQKHKMLIAQQHARIKYT